MELPRPEHREHLFYINAMEFSPVKQRCMGFSLSAIPEIAEITNDNSFYKIETTCYWQVINNKLFIVGVQGGVTQPVNCPVFAGQCWGHCRLKAGKLMSELTNEYEHELTINVENGIVYLSDIKHNDFPIVTIDSFVGPILPVEIALNRAIDSDETH